MSRLIVVEVNELPLRVLRWWGEENPDSALWRLAVNGSVTETILDESLPRDLYPSQSWASVGMGVPWEKHQVFWYGDPKPAEFPFYWQVAAQAGMSVGLVGVLHSSPLKTQCGSENFKFVIPDSFSDNADTRPRSLEGLQKLNLRLSRESARVAKLKPSVVDLGGVASFATNGVRVGTWAALAGLAGRVGAGRWNKERFRVGQALLMADVFERQVRVHNPDVAVLFTNHIASAMHRYWAATFPQDWGNDLPYPPDWRLRHAKELPYAMASLDKIIGRLQKLAAATDRGLVIVTSMGQKADLSLGVDKEFQAVIRDPGRFLDAAGAPAPMAIHSAMVPQLTMEFSDEPTAADAEGCLIENLGTAVTETMSSGSTLTISYALECDENSVRIGDSWISAEAAGVSIERITDHRAGHHSKRGLFISGRAQAWPSEVDAFRVAPTLLDLLGVEPLGHHERPLSTG